jgi:hypothetical protein
MPPASPLPPRDLQGSSKGPDKLFDGAASSKKDDARVNEEAYHSRLGHNLMEQFNLLWRQLAQQKGHPRNVVARSRKTRDHAELDRIAAHREYDRDCFGDQLGQTGYSATHTSSAVGFAYINSRRHRTLPERKT